MATVSGYHTHRKLISYPFEIEWGGWTSTTARLQQSGWSIAAEEDFNSMFCRLALRHDVHRIYGLTNRVPAHFLRIDQHMLGAIRFQVQYMASRLQVQIMDNLSHFRPIDACPQFITEMKDIEDFKFFAAPLARTEEIIVDPADVGRLLEMIREAQSPRQAEIRERMRKRDAREGLELDARPRQQFHAQILSFAA